MFMIEAGLFKGIASHIINEIAGIATEEIYSAGQVIFEKDDIADYLYILEEGEVKITFPGKKPVTFQVEKSGHMLGWSAMMEPSIYTARGECVKESKLIKIDGGRLTRIFENHPSEGLLVMKRLAGAVSSRLVKCYQEISP